MNGTDKKFQWTGQWTRNDNGVAISENFTFRSDDWKELTDKRWEVLSDIAPSAKSFPEDTGTKAHVATSEPTPICDIHKTPMKLKPAGISKSTGKPYNAFWTCGTQLENGNWCAYRPPKV